MASLEFVSPHNAVPYLAFSYLISYRRGIFTRELDLTLASSRQGQALIVSYLSGYDKQIGAS